ncbi:MAG: carbon storage regulator [Myxococcales bacterium]|nr:carbon storage regulator [Myxococcales bacterium]MCB9579356.1 carbon storage regulator [Polyangiaceae bacterium]
MFVIARRRGQRVIIGSDLEIVVTEVHRGTVKLGIVAPKSQTILRGEVFDAIERANREACTTSLDDARSCVAPPRSVPPAQD